MKTLKEAMKREKGDTEKERYADRGQVLRSRKRVGGGHLGGILKIQGPSRLSSAACSATFPLTGKCVSLIPTVILRYFGKFRKYK